MFLASALAGGATLDANSLQGSQPQIKTWKESRKKELDERKAGKMKFKAERKSALKGLQKERKGTKKDRKELKLKNRGDRKAYTQKEWKALAKEKDPLKERKLIQKKKRERV
jgi:hypothetical protein